MADFVEFERVVPKKENPLKKMFTKVKEVPKNVKRMLGPKTPGRTSPPPPGGKLEQLTPQQMKKLRTSFDLFDEDKSGGIDKAEMTKVAPPPPPPPSVNLALP